jgi:hypothetical protein
MFGFDRFVKHFAMGGFSSGLSALFAPGCSAFNCTTGSGPCPGGPSSCRCTVTTNPGGQHPRFRCVFFNG